MSCERLYLAPMEGVCDPPMRKVLCAVGGYDECFSEFIRVSDVVLPYKTLWREVPELREGGKTPDGTPVRVQLLGDRPGLMARTAKRAEEIGAKAIDINFGCPSRFVHHAGSMLLKEPSLMHEIVARVRDILEPETLLSVKVRLGFESKHEAPVIVQAIAVPGVNEIIVHARTRKELYREECLDWSAIAPLHELAGEAVLVANGEIVSLDSALECMRLSECRRLMIGRGALMVPNAGHVVKDGAEPLSNSELLQVALSFMDELEARHFPEKSVMDRLKQFLGFARRHNPELTQFFKRVCKIGSASQARELLDVTIERGFPLTVE